MRKTKSHADADDVLRIVYSWEDLKEAVNFHLDEAERFGLDRCRMNNGSFVSSFRRRELGDSSIWYVSFTPIDGAKWTDDMLSESTLIELAVRKRRRS